METLMQIRNGLLQKLEKKRKFELHDYDSLKKRKTSSDEKEVVDSPKEHKTTNCLKKHDNKSGFSENQKLISFLKHRKKRSDLLKKINTNSHFRNKLNSKGDCSKKQRKKLQVVQSLPAHSKKNVGGSLKSENLKRKSKLKKKNDEVVRDDASQLHRRARNLLVKLKLEQNLIDAYTGEGWKGQSREKIKPEKELQRAIKQVLNCKLGIRETVRQLDLLGSVGQIDDFFISSDGSVHHEHIFCKKCKTQEISEDNDIILCDGTCNCAFHQKCIDPPLATKDIPPEDEGWLCKYCDCKMDLLDVMNAHLGTQFAENCMWQDIFKEEALISDAGIKDSGHEEQWPDDESDDNDYDPDSDKMYCTDRCSTGYNSVSHEESSTSSSSCSLESEVHWESGLSTESNEISSGTPLRHRNCVLGFNDNEIISGPRQRSTVDYRKLYDEMFVKDVNNSDVFSEDEDWDPRRRRRRKKECDAAKTLMTLCVSEVKPSDSQTQEVEKDHPPDTKIRKARSKIPAEILQKLRQAFAENELPSKDVKKDISDLVGLEFRKVNKWFKNARYIALKSRKKRQSPQSTVSIKSDAVVDAIIEPIVTKCPLPILARKKQLKKVSWNDNLTTLLSSAKKKRLKRASLGNDKANVEIDDDMSLKKHLLHLKAKSKQEKGERPDTQHPQVVSAEMQMEQLCQIEAKLWKLKQVVSTFHNATNDNHNDQHLVVYVPFAEVKEKS